jgi:hypothetical protein
MAIFSMSTTKLAALHTEHPSKQLQPHLEAPELISPPIDLLILGQAIAGQTDIPVIEAENEGVSMTRDTMWWMVPMVLMTAWTRTIMTTAVEETAYTVTP